MQVIRGLVIVLRPAPARSSPHRTALPTLRSHGIILRLPARASQSARYRAAHPLALPTDTTIKHRMGITMAQAVVSNVAPEGEIQLDRASFTEIVHLKALRVPTARCQELMKKFSG